MRRSLARTLISLERFADAEIELASQIEIIETTPVTSELMEASWGPSDTDCQKAVQDLQDLRSSAAPE
jgi:hypothetical protein